jgi:hypothetical protein
MHIIAYGQIYYKTFHQKQSNKAKYYLKNCI